MVYKSIDFQASVPRTLEMTQLAHQQQQRPVQEQNMLAHQQQKADERQAQRSPKTEAPTGGTINDRDPRDGAKRQGSGKRRKTDQQNESEAKPIEHPYKGKHIDFTG